MNFRKFTMCMYRQTYHLLGDSMLPVILSSILQRGRHWFHVGNFYSNHDNPSYGHSVKLASRFWEISSHSIFLQDSGSLLCWSRGPSELIYLVACIAGSVGPCVWLPEDVRFLLRLLCMAFRSALDLDRTILWETVLGSTLISSPTLVQDLSEVTLHVKS